MHAQKSRPAIRQARPRPFMPDAVRVAEGSVIGFCSLRPHDSMGGRLHHCWVACAPELGGNDPAGRLTIDSGVLNPELLGTLPGSKEWARGRLRDRSDATVAHEHEEARRVEITTRRSSTRQSPNCRSREGGQHILRAMQSKERLR
jgi:hypothetical protein